MIEIIELPQFFETKCNFCGARLRYHVEDLKGNLQFSCPNCGWLVEHKVGNAVFKEEAKEAEKGAAMMNLPEDLSEEDYDAILDSFDRTIEMAGKKGKFSFSCPWVSCEKCPVENGCINAYDEKTWKELKEAWEKAYE